MTSNNRYNQYSLGYDTLLNQLDAVSGRSINYPPYNIVKVDENNYRLELAVAGFNNGDLEVTQERDKLRVTGFTPEMVEQEGIEMLHKGISSKSFNLDFKLIEHINVTNAALVNGILTVRLEREVPEEQKPKLIKIK